MSVWRLHSRNSFKTVATLSNHFHKHYEKADLSVFCVFLLFRQKFDQIRNCSQQRFIRFCIHFELNKLYWIIFIVVHCWCSDACVPAVHSSCCVKCFSCKLMWFLIFVHMQSHCGQFLKLCYLNVDARVLLQKCYINIKRMQTHWGMHMISLFFAHQH